MSSVPDHARGHLWLGLVYIMTRRAAQGIAKCEYALALDRNLATAHSAIGYGKIFISRAEEKEAHIGEALAPQSARYDGLYLDEYGGSGESFTLEITSRQSRGADGSIEANRNFRICKF